MDGGEDSSASIGGQENVKGRSVESSYGASPIAVVVAYWREFDLENARVSLDEQGMKIAENQESSSKNRRKLAELTRDFKKASTEEKTKPFTGVLKAFQEEVDNLTKRAKYGENSFLNIYQKLYEAPDPLPALISAAEASTRTGELEQENRKMKQELEQFRTESAHLKNQQATVRRLEERNRQLEQQMEEKVKEMVSMKQQVLAEESQKSFETLKDRENQLHEQLRAARESVQNMQRLHELGQSQLFELKAQSEEDRAAKQSEFTLLTDEVDRATSRLLSLEREKETLKSQLQVSQSQETPHLDKMDADSNSLEATLSVKERVISELHMELHNVESTLSTEREEHLFELKNLHSRLDEKEELVGNLQAELHVRATDKQVEELRKQVKFLQAIAYNAVETEDWDTPGRSGDMGKLETLLLEKNRKVEHELTQVKVQLSAKEKEAEEALIKMQQFEAKVAEQKMLIARLEDDIVKGYGTGDQRMAKGGEWDVPEARMTDLLQNNGNSSQGGKGVGGEEEEKTMLSVVCGQRDRFRQKLVEVEEELRRLRENRSALLLDLEKTKNDSVKLYEKFRYVQEYNKDRGGPQNRGPKKREEDLEAGGGSEVEARYKKIYEETINPFAAFSNKEKEQRYKELGLRDRITLTSGRFLLANKHARTFVFFYSIGLHILVFLSVYRLSALSHYSVSYNSDALESKKAILAAAKNATKLAQAAKSATLTG